MSSLLALENSTKQLRLLACRRVSLTIVFYKNSSSGITLPVVLLVYVDDIVITGSDSKSIVSLKSYLHSQFHTRI